MDKMLRVVRDTLDPHYDIDVEPEFQRDVRVRLADSLDVFFSVESGKRLYCQCDWDTGLAADDPAVLAALSQACNEHHESCPEGKLAIDGLPGSERETGTGSVVLSASDLTMCFPRVPDEVIGRAAIRMLSGVYGALRKIDDAVGFVYSLPEARF